MPSVCAFTQQPIYFPETSDIKKIDLTGPYDTHALRKISENISTDYIFIYTGHTPVHLEKYSLDRMLQIAEMTGAPLLYSDYHKVKDGGIIANPTIEYQLGSLRDDFDFGPLILYRTDTFRQAVEQMAQPYHYASLYDLRLRISRLGKLVRIPEYLYTVAETDTRLSGEKQFDYVNPSNRAVQIEMERACTEHLKATHAWLSPTFQEANFDNGSFPVEATVVIPVKNRAKTITDAVKSALQQQTSFAFNIIVVDNYSTDGTTGILQQLTATYPEVIHHIPEHKGLGIGGCWNEAILHPACGKFAVQLDSDDLYIDGQVLQSIIRTFYEQKCAMVIGSYKMVNFNLEEIPPGIIDHREWTPDNGRNNALRINGLGAPRAFCTSILRQLKFPDVSYGEDYAVGLALSRSYQIGRIYEPLYLCRRWEENSDAALDIQKLNTYNSYKDWVRTQELICRLNHE